MKAEPRSHEEHDALISPRRNLATSGDARIESQGQEVRAAEDEKDIELRRGEGEVKDKYDEKEGERQEKDNEKEGERQENHSAPSIAPLPRAVPAVGGTLEVGKDRRRKKGKDRRTTVLHPLRRCREQC